MFRDINPSMYVCIKVAFETGLRAHIPTHLLGGCVLRDLCM